jgi:hypothetical protein
MNGHKQPLQRYNWNLKESLKAQQRRLALSKA